MQKSAGKGECAYLNFIEAGPGLAFRTRQIGLATDSGLTQLTEDRASRSGGIQESKEASVPAKPGNAGARYGPTALSALANTHLRQVALLLHEAKDSGFR
jgi:hypothetical protein